MTQEEELRHLTNLFHQQLSEFHLNAVQEYLDHGENTVALEMLCDFLGDHSVVLGTFQYEEINRVGQLLGLDTDDLRFTYLKTLMASQ